MSIFLGQHPTDVPEPFASLLRDQPRGAAEPAPRVLGPTAHGCSPARSPAGTCIPTPSWTDSATSVSTRSARNRAIGELVLECPPSLVAEALGYSTQVAFLHADTAAAEPWARYAGRSTSGL